MKNKKRNILKVFIINIYIIFNIYNSNAQTTKTQLDKIEILKAEEAYFESVKAKDNQKTIEYLYPKLFDIYPKDMLIKAMNSMYEDTTMVFNFDNSKIIKMSNVETVDGVKYALLKYSYVLTIEFIEKSIDTTQNEEDVSFDMKEILLQVMKNDHGEKNVTFDKTKKIMTVNATNELYAINDPKYSGWKFLEKKEKLAPIIEKLLPIKKLKKLKY